MNRKEFLAVVISAALGLSGAPVYASESAAFSDGEVQEYGAEEEKQEFQTDSQDPDTTDDGLETRGVQRGSRAQHLGARQAGAFPRVQIGRASCRERV